MIWLFGGGFMVGGSMGPNFLNNYLYSGQEIADKGDVVVVSVGYRVGTLGFLSTGDSLLPGKGGWRESGSPTWSVLHIHLLEPSGVVFKSLQIARLLDVLTP